MSGGITNRAVQRVAIAPKQIRFGSPEVRTYRHDGWETKPLLDIHEVARLEAKIKKASYQPMAKPVPCQKKLLSVSHKKYSRLTAICVGTFFATVIACGLGGPFGLIVPAAVLAICGAHWFLTKPLAPPAPKPPQKPEVINAIKHLESRVRKYQKVGLVSHADIFQQILEQSKKHYRI